MIELGLSESFLSAQNAVLRAALDRCLRLVDEALGLQDDPDEHLDLSDAVQRCRRQIADATDTDQISAIADACFELCGAAMGRARARAGAHRMQLEAMVAFIRATLANLTGDSLSSELIDTTRRLDALAKLDDIVAMKAGLDAEVMTVTHVVRARQRALQKQVESLQQQLSDAETQLAAAQEDAARDELTGVANRRHFERLLDRAMQSPAQQVVVGLIDVDNFKAINDTHGHQAGDNLLVALADALRAALESPDVVARLGGDEFAVIMYGVTLRRAEYLLKNIVTQVSTMRVAAGATDVGLSISSGLAEFSAGDTRKTLVGRADQALYEAKRGGKQRVAAKSVPLIRDVR
jgi:diguanylate cyclase (GGDEF)-like protein